MVNLSVCKSYEIVQWCAHSNFKHTLNNVHVHVFTVLYVHVHSTVHTCIIVHVYNVIRAH